MTHSNLGSDLASNLAYNLDASTVPPLSSVPPLPAAAVEYWIQNAGLGMGAGTKLQSWTGQLRATVVQAPSTPLQPTLDADGALFGGRAVVQFAGGTTLWTLADVAPLSAAATKPHVYVVGRFRSYPSSQTCLVSFADSLPSANGWAAGSIQANASAPFAWWYPHGQTIESPVSASPFVVKRYQTLIDAAGHTVLRVNGTATLSGSVGLTSPSSCKAVQFGADRGASNADGCLALVLLATSEMTAPELAALDAWAASYYGA